MLKDDVRPLTIEGVKRLAVQLKKDREIKHANALDVAAKAAGCANYRHARSVLPLNTLSPRRYLLLLTTYWYDTKNYKSGRETLEVRLSRPVLEICGKLDLKQVRGFGSRRMVAEDHFVDDNLAHSQSFARGQICKAARSLQFMEETGLRPSRKFAMAYPSKVPGSSLPSSDHSTYWVDPANKQFVLVDEPYRHDPSEEDRAAWARKHGWLVRKSTWAGMYFPYSCSLYIATDDSRGYDVDALMMKIDNIQAPITEETWTGESVPSLEVFVSPAAKTPQDRRRARSKGTVMPVPTGTTLPYSSMFGNFRRRPVGTMTIAGHIEMGRIIKAVLHSSNRPYSVYRRMNAVRSTLEDWMSLEISRGQLEGPEFFDVYYHERDREGLYAEAARSRSGLVWALDELKQKLQAAYLDCAPLRKQLRQIDMAISLIVRMRSAA